MLTRKYFPALQKTEILPENPVSETRNHTLVIETRITFFSESATGAKNGYLYSRNNDTNFSNRQPATESVT